VGESGTTKKKGKKKKMVGGWFPLQKKPGKKTLREGGLEGDKKNRRFPRTSNLKTHETRYKKLQGGKNGDAGMNATRTQTQSSWGGNKQKMTAWGTEKVNTGVL